MVTESLLLEFLTDDSSIVVNKRLLKEYGPDTAVFLSNLISRYKFLKNANQLIENHWFSLPHKTQIEDIGLTISKLRKCKLFLTEQNIIEIRKIGVPSKEHYKLNWEVILSEIYNIKSVNQADVNRMVGQPSGFLTTMRTRNISPHYNLTYYSVSKYEEKNIKNYFREESKEKGKKIRQPKIDQLIMKSLFEKFWSIYPKKTDKGKALTAWNRLCGKKDRPSWKQIRRAIYAQTKSERWQDRKFIPLPTTWINQSRWLDDPNEMRNTWTSISANNTPKNKFEPMFEEMGKTL